MTLTSLPSELHLQILSYLPPSSLYNLLFTCKQLHPIAHQQLWSYLGFLSKVTAENLTSASTSNSNTLNSLSEKEDHYFPNTVTKSKVKQYLLLPSKWKVLINIKSNDGWKLVKGIIFGGFDILFEAELMKTLKDKIETGYLKPQFIEIYLGDTRDHIHALLNPPKDTPLTTALSLFSTIKSSSSTTTTTAPNPLQLSLQLPCYTIPDLESFPLHTLTTLSFGISHPSLNHLFNPSGQILQISKYLTTISSSTTLKSLTITNNAHGIVLQPLENNSPELEQLQKAFTSLKTLYSLKLSYRFFNASLFITPPENVKILCYDDFEVTNDWWYQFSNAELKNVEWLRIGVRWYHSGVTGDNSDARGIGSFKGNKIKRFYWDGYKSFIPKDLVNCVLEANPGLTIKGKGCLSI
ncbi:hypothetical protein TWF506_011044 [Arthrobotrys conoides]|uniref:F-box domain-containing protein n=1 Tax=Arthrobotrys conoides TaxID=74498 RepID=A0AAN8NDU0_9PEZI